MSSPAFPSLSLESSPSRFRQASFVVSSPSRKTFLTSSMEESSLVAPTGPPARTTVRAGSSRRGNVADDAGCSTVAGVGEIAGQKTTDPPEEGAPAGPRRGGGDAPSQASPVLEAIWRGLPVGQPR